MHRKRLHALGLALLVPFVPAAAFDIDRDTVRLRTVEIPAVDVVGLDYASLRAELAFGDLTIGEPELRTTKSWCYPEHSENPIKDAIEVPTHYYEVPYEVAEGVVVVRDGSGSVIYTAGIDALESSERFGYDTCEYWVRRPLEEAFARQYGSLEAQIEKSVRKYFTRNAERKMDAALFFHVVEEKVPVYTFRDKLHDYSDLNGATARAREAYAEMELAVAGSSDAGKAGLTRAIEIWEAALGEADLNDRTARINRKTAIKLHESIGVAWLALGDPGRAVAHLEKASRYSSMSTSRSDGTGTRDLIDRARGRRARDLRSPALPDAPDALRALMQRSNTHRNRVPLVVLPQTALARLEAEHVAFSAQQIFALADAEQEQREADLAAGRENPYEQMIGHTATQGFYLFLMPYPKKMDAFPEEVCELTHINRLRMPNHRFAHVPDGIGRLEALEVLDLSGNRIRELPDSIGELADLEKLDLSKNDIRSLPDSIGKLEKLKVLQLKGNPLADGELERLERLLPKCKIKA